MNSSFTKNGNIKGVFALVLIVFGLLGVYFSIKVLFNINKVLALVVLLVSFTMVVFGGISGRAKALGLKPFDNKKNH